MGVFRACVWHRLCNGKAFSGQQDLTQSPKKCCLFPGKSMLCSLCLLLACRETGVVVCHMNGQAEL